MPQSRYFVVQRSNDWVIKFHDEEFGPYQSKNEAMLFAVDAAQRLGQGGEHSEVCLKGENGRFRPEWTFGRDRYPPTL
jgi:hypothetical protein